MRMDSGSRSHCSSKLLKLVHPGGFAEIHKEPITAAEVMNKYPRHCVTRPDVFEFPWIVVRPESVLKPGSVFFIVPYHTIHRLLQKNKCRNRSQTLPAHQQDFHRHYKESFSPTESWSKHESKHCTGSSDGYHPFEERGSIESSVELTHFHDLVMKNNCLNQSQERAKIDCKFEEFHDDVIFPKCLIGTSRQCFDDPGHDRPHSQNKKQYQVERWLNRHKQRNSAEARYSFQSNTTASRDARASNGGITMKDFQLSSSQEERILKSCLKKDKISSKSRDCRVKFALPGEDERNLRVEVYEFEPIECP